MNSSSIEEQLKQFFRDKQEPLRHWERRVTFALLALWLVLLFADSAMTLKYCRSPEDEGNIPLSELMRRYGIPAALGIGILFHFALVAGWAAVCFAIHIISKRMLDVPLYIARLVPLYGFLIRDSGEHLYGLTTWL